MLDKTQLKVLRVYRLSRVREQLINDEYLFIAYPEDLDDTGFDGVLREGMTVCVEAYGGEIGGSEGVKLEAQALITAGGVERLSTYPCELDFL